MRQHLLVGMALVFCLGIILFSLCAIPLCWLFAFAAILLLLSVYAKKSNGAFSLFAATLIFSLGIIHAKNFSSVPACHVCHVAGLVRTACLIRGVVKSPATVKNNKTSFILQTQEIACKNFRCACCGDILVVIKGKKNIDSCEQIAVYGRLNRVERVFSNASKSYRRYLRHQRIYFILQAESTGSVTVLGRKKGNVLLRFALFIKKRMQERIRAYVRPVTAGVLEAMILGDKKNIPPTIYNTMIKTGTVHIMVVSGFNVGIVAFVITLFLKIIRVPRPLRFMLTLALLLLYCLITGASNPVVRATVMAVVFLSSYFVRRMSNIYNSCALAALFILGGGPLQLFDIGFQLSFVSVISIAYLYPRLKTIFGSLVPRMQPIGFIVDNFLVSLSAWLGTAGLIAYYFRIFSPITVVANILIVPLATLITLCGFSLLAVIYLCPPLALFFASSSELIVMILLNLNAALLRVPGAYLKI